ncbi:hypothetical protein [Tenacibaculum aestuariivivum]|uniref:hypothetical protein n=1 Tax=Tenacibaculum aestuariivivum TaxID=2006131 RepID=UPI003AB39C5C
MNTLWKYLQYGYLIIGTLFFIEGVLKWNSDKQEALILFGFGIFITLVFLLKRYFRKKVNKRNKQ